MSSEYEVHVSGCFGRDPAAQCAGVLLAKTPSGELEFAVPGWDVRTVDYAVALSLHQAPLSDHINLRRISARLANPRSAYIINRYLEERGDDRVKDWASWVANANSRTATSGREARTQ